MRGDCARASPLCRPGAATLGNERANFFPLAHFLTGTAPLVEFPGLAPSSKKSFDESKIPC